MDAFREASVPTKGIVGLTLLAILVAVLQRALRVDLDPREPPVVPSKIPIIGHVLGMVRHGKRYYQMIEDKYGRDIYTIPLPGARQYIITSPALAAAVHRQSKIISFRPFIVDFTKTMLQFDDAAHAIHTKNLFDEEGVGLISANNAHFYSSLPSGPALDEISMALLAGVARSMDRLSASAAGGGGLTVGLWRWCLEIIGTSTVDALWGPDNLFTRDPSLVPAFWEMEESLVALGVGVLPQLVAPAAHRARARLTDAMEQFYADESRWRQASWLVRERARIHFKHGFTPREFAKADVGLLVGALPNSSFATFWTLARVLADGGLLAEIRAELLASGAVSLSSVEGGGENKRRKKATVGIAGLRGRCALLASTFREVLRLGMPTSSMRTVREDVLLADRHLLRKGATVMHGRREVWGADAAEFNPRRFLDGPAGIFTGPGGDGNSGGNGNGNGKKVHAAAFRGFGGGEVFCPGRNLAQAGITGIVAAVVCGWELAPGCEVTVPAREDDEIPIGIWKPRSGVEVKLRRREG